MGAAIEFVAPEFFTDISKGGIVAIPKGRGAYDNTHGTTHEQRLQNYYKKSLLRKMRDEDKERNRYKKRGIRTPSGVRFTPL